MIREYKVKFDWIFWFLVLCPTFYLSGHDLRNVQESFFQISVIALLGILHVNRFIGFFILFSCFQFIFFKDMIGTASILQNLFFGALIYQFIVLFADRDKFKNYFWALAGILILNVLWIPIQAWGHDPIWSMREMHNQTIITDIPSWFGLPAFLGNYSAVIAPILAFISPPLALISIPALIVSKSSFSVIAAFIGLCFYAFFINRKFFLALLITGILGTSFMVYKDLPGGQFSRRLNVWNEILKKGFHSQFFGYGLGAYGKNYSVVETSPDHRYYMIDEPWQVLALAREYANREDKSELSQDILTMGKNKNYNFHVLSRKMQKNGMDIKAWNEAHNEFIQVFFDTGLVGIFIVGMYVFNLFKRFLKYGRKNKDCVALAACFVALMVICMGHFPFHVARLAGPFIVITAFFELSLIRMKKATDAYI